MRAAARTAWLVALLCVLSCLVLVQPASAATVQVFKDATCTADSGAGVISLVPINQCEAVASGDSGSLRLTCSSGQLMYEQWQAKSNTDCSGPADIVASSTVNAPSTCMTMTLSGQPTPGSIRVDCNSAATMTASLLMMPLLAVLANRAAAGL